MSAILLSFLVLFPGENASLFCPEPLAQRGEVRGGPVLEHAFTLINRGSSPLTISDVSGSCGCLIPKLSTRTLGPGASARLEVAVGTVTQPDGPNTWKIEVKYRDMTNRLQTLELQLKASLVREVGLAPAAVQLIGGPGIQHEVMIMDRRRQPLKLTAVQASSPRLKVRSEHWEKDADGWKCRLQVQLADDCPVGAWDETIQILSDEADYRELRVPVRIVCRGAQRVLISPDMVQLRYATGKPTPSVMVLLRDAKGAPVEIASVECADAALTARFADGAHATGAIRLSVVSGKMPQPRSTVKIQIRKPAAETLTVPVEVAP